MGKNWGNEKLLTGVLRNFLAVLDVSENFLENATAGVLQKVINEHPDLTQSSITNKFLKNFSSTSPAQNFIVALAIYQKSYHFLLLRLLLFIKIFISGFFQVSFSFCFPGSVAGAANCLRMCYLTWPEKVRMEWDTSLRHIIAYEVSQK